MVAFTSLIVIVTAGLSVVSAAAVSKRDITTDAANIEAAISDIDEIRKDSDVKAIDPQDPVGTTARLTQDMDALVSTLFTAAIEEEGQPQFTSTQEPIFANVNIELDALIGDLKAAVPIIKSIPGLTGVVQLRIGELSSTTAAYINSLIGLLPPAIKTDAAGDEAEILMEFQAVQILLSTASS